MTNDRRALGFFSAESSASPGWPADGVAALYLAGMVVDRGARGRGVGELILRGCAAEAERSGSAFVRLDCHIGTRGHARITSDTASSSGAESSSIPGTKDVSTSSRSTRAAGSCPEIDRGRLLTPDSVPRRSLFLDQLHEESVELRVSSRIDDLRSARHGRVAP